MLSELDTRNAVIQKLHGLIGEDEVLCEDVEILSTAWVTESAKQKKKLDFNDFKLPAATLQNVIIFCGKNSHEISMNLSYTGMILGMGSANERRHNYETPSLIGGAIHRIIPDIDGSVWKET